MPTSLGPAEIMVILIVALIVLGPKRLPEAGRQVGKAIAEVRKWSQGFQDEIRNAVEPNSSPPSYSEPQPGYQPPIPVESTAPGSPVDDVSPPPSDRNGSSVPSESPGLSSDAAPADEPTPSTEPSGPPAGEPPRT